MDFTDLAGRYLQSRMDQATMPFTNPEAYANQRLGLPTSADVSNEANVIPKSTTISYNPDGTQTVTEKKEVTPPAPQPAPVAQPVAPTPAPQPAPAPVAQPVEQQPVAPVAPTPVPAPAPAPVAQQPQPVAPIAPRPVAQPAPQPVPSTAPTAQPQVTPVGGLNLTPEQLQLQQAGIPIISGYRSPEKQAALYTASQQPGYQGPPVAPPGRSAHQGGNAIDVNTATLTPEQKQSLMQQGYTQPYANDPNHWEKRPASVATNGINQPGGMIPSTTAPAVSQAQYNQTTGTPATEGDINLYWGKQVIDNLNDPVKLAQVYKDPNAPEFAKIAAARQTTEMLSSSRDMQQAMKKVNADLESGDTKAIGNLLAKKSDEGSYIKAYLFQRLGLNDLAKEEQQKLGAGRVWEQNTLDTGETALIQRDAQGLPLYGISQSGKELTPSELVRFGGAPVKGTAQHAQVYKDPFGQIQGNFALETRPGRAPVFREISTGRLATPQESAKLNAVGVAGPLEQIYAASYLKGGGSKQGQQAAEGYAQGTLPGAPGFQGAPGAGTAGAPPVSGPVTGGGAPVVNANPNIPSASATAAVPVYLQKKQADIAEKRTESFNKIIDTEYRDNAGKGEVIVNNRKQQFDILNRDDPTTGKKVAEQISGLYNAANENPTNQSLTIIRDIFGGKFKPETEVSERIAQLNLSPAMKSALLEYNALNAQIAGQTLRETAGPGSVSDSEQQANRARNVDITKTPMLGAYNMMSQSQFNGDLQRYKADLAASPNNMASNATAFDRDFRKHQSELVKSYREVAEARLKFIQDNGSSPTAIREGYKRYPVPEYDPTTGNWRYLKPLDQIIKKKDNV